MYIYYLYLVVSFILYYTATKDVAVTPLRTGKIIKRVPDSIIITMGVLLVLIFALRDMSVGTDTSSYYEHYRYDDVPNWRNGILAGEEALFRYLEYVCNALGMSWQLFLAVTSIIIVAPMIVFFKRYSNDVWASLLIYITIGLFTMNLSGLRQSLAVSMVLLATMEIIEGRILKFMVWVIIGAGFHYSALFALSLIFVHFFEYKNAKQLTILLFLPLVARLAGDLLFSNLSSFMPDRYENFSDMDGTINPLLEIMQFSILFFCYLSLIINKNVSKLDFFLYFIVVFYVSAIELSHSVYMAGRLAFYFEMAAAVAIPNFIHKFKDNSTKQILSLSIYSLCLAAFVVASYGSNTLGYNEYKFFWE